MAYSYRCIAQRARNPLALAAILLGIFTHSAQAANIVPNPSFSNECPPASGLPCSWFPQGSPSIARDTTTFMSSSASLRVTTTESNLGAYSDCMLLAPGTHAASFAYWVTDLSVTGVDLIAFFYPNATCAPVPSGIPVDFVSARSPFGLFWFEAAGNVTAPPGTASARLYLTVACNLSCPPTGATAHFDDVSLESVALAVTMRSLSATSSSTGALLRWRTASELDTLGFNVFRELKGRRARVNPRLIAAKGPGSYSFLDRHAPAGKRLSYWLQVVNLDGSRNWWGPVATRPPRKSTSPRRMPWSPRSSEVIQSQSKLRAS